MRPWKSPPPASSAPAGRAASGSRSAARVGHPRSASRHGAPGAAARAARAPPAAEGSHQDREQANRDPADEEQAAERRPVRAANAVAQQGDAADRQDRAQENADQQRLQEPVQVHGAYFLPT